MAFATPTQLRTELGLAQIDNARATQVLDAASNRVRTAAGVRVDEVVDDTVTLDGNGSAILLLPDYPVTAVVSVAVDGTALTTDDYEWSRTGVLERVHGRWPRRARAVTVTYTHGFPATEIPEDLVTVTISAAARAWENPTDHRSDGIGGYNARYEAGTALTFDEVEMVRRAIR